MTTATAAPPPAVPTPAAPPTPSVPNPVEWVKALPVEDREAVFLELLREVMTFNGTRGRIDIETQDEQYLGYFVPAEAERLAAQKELGDIDPEWEAEQERRGRESPGIPVQQVIAELRAEAARLVAAESR